MAQPIPPIGLQTGKLFKYKPHLIVKIPAKQNGYSQQPRNK